MTKRLELNSYSQNDEVHGDYVVYEIKYADGHKEYVSRSVFRELKALEIIRDKGVDILKLKECKRCKLPNEYNTRSCYSYHKELTQEEFDLLKEIML